MCKEKIPRYKSCAGGLTTRVRDILDFDFSSAIEDTITHVSLAYDARRVRIPTSTAWCVMRERFDALLAERTARAGAELRDAQPVTRLTFDDSGASVTTRGETLRATFVVGAGGVNGIVRRASKEIFARRHRIPLGGQRARYHAPRVVLVGDVAGLADPFTAEGIYYAIRTGRTTAEEIARALHRGERSVLISPPSSPPNTVRPRARSG
jgi:flavin-dependent dehydrogenase